MIVTELLKKQHRKVEKLFAALEKGKGDKQAQLDELANDLAAHMAIEHEIVYPAANAVDSDLISEAFEEHAVAELALKRLLATDLESDEFTARVVVLKELIQHHVEEEEETLFPKMEKKLGAERLREMGTEAMARFVAVQEAGPMTLVPKTPAAKTSADKGRKRMMASEA